MINKSTISYLIFGLLTTVVNIVTYAFLASFLNVDYKLATTVAWILSILFAFITNKLFVFNSKEITFVLMVKELVNFVIFRLLSLLVDIIIMFIIIDLLLWNDLFAKVIANGVVVVMNYFTSKNITFKKNSGIKELQ